MKICIDAREFVKNRKTGIGRYLETFLPAMLEHSGFEIILLVTDPAALPDKIARYKTECITVPSAPTILADQILIPRMAEENRADIFFSPYYKVPLSGRFKRIITVHDIMFLRLPGKNLIRKFLASLQLRLAAGKTDIILVDSEFTRKDLIDYIPGAATKISLLYPALGEDWLNNIHSTRSNSIVNKYTGGRPYFLYAGNFKLHKNVHLLVKAFRKLLADNLCCGHCLILAGGDHLNVSMIEQLAGSSIHDGSIRIIRDIDDTELKALYAEARWFISASQYEGFGYPMLEAMISGCPVICTNLTSIPEVTGNINIPIIKPELSEIIPAIKKAMATGDGERNALIKKGLDTARQFISKNQADAILNVLNNVMER